MFEGYSLESLGKRAPVRHAKDCIESMDNVLLIGSFPESALNRDDFGRLWQNWVSAASTARRCGASYALIMPKMSKFGNSELFVKFSNDFVFDTAIMDVCTTWLSSTCPPTANYAIVSNDPYFINQFAGCRKVRDDRGNPTLDQVTIWK